MSKYIDAVSAATIIAEKHGIPLADLVDTFAEIQKADVVPVRRGNWCWIIDDIYRCDNCGEASRAKEMSGDPAWYYCPNCGARMDGEVER